MYELFATDTFIKDLKSLDKPSREHLGKLLKKLREQPDRFKPLKSYPNHYRLRFEKYRLVYKIEGHTVALLSVRKRDIVYKEFGRG